MLIGLMTRAHNMMHLSDRLYGREEDCIHNDQDGDTGHLKKNFTKIERVLYMGIRRTVILLRIIHMETIIFIGKSSMCFSAKTYRFKGKDVKNDIR